MITAVDTNVLLDILLPHEEFVAMFSQALETAATAGSLVVCDIVYAELCTAFARQEDCDRFLADNEIHVEPLSHRASFMASRTWQAYRRRGGSRTRILPDFLIGAHARLQASRLLSRDRAFYSRLFPTLTVVHP